MMHGGDILSFNLKYGQKPIDFSANISPLGVANGIKKAIIENLEDISLYPDPKCRKLTHAIASFEQVGLEHIICGNGAADLIFRLTYSLQPKKALILAPTFSEYEQALNAVNCEISYFYLQKETDFELNCDILQQINSKIDILFICQPNNPTGKIANKQLMLEILEKCEKNGVFLVIDECFIDFVQDFEQFSMKNERKSNVFILKAFTKMYALAGARVGYGICYNRELLQKMHTNFQPWAVSHIAQIAGIQATIERDYARNVRSLVEKEREYLQNSFKKLGIKYIESSANFILFYAQKLDFLELLAQKGILIRDCSNYVGLQKGYYRIAVKTHKENCALIDAMTEIIENEVN